MQSTVRVRRANPDISAMGFRGTPFYKRLACIPAELCPPFRVPNKKWVPFTKVPSLAALFWSHESYQMIAGPAMWVPNL